MSWFIFQSAALRARLDVSPDGLRSIVIGALTLAMVASQGERDAREVRGSRGCRARRMRVAQDPAPDAGTERLDDVGLQADLGQGAEDAKRGDVGRPRDARHAQWSPAKRLEYRVKRKRNHRYASAGCAARARSVSQTLMHSLAVQSEDIHQSAGGWPRHPRDPSPLDQDVQRLCDVREFIAHVEGEAFAGQNGARMPVKEEQEIAVARITDISDAIKEASDRVPRHTRIVREKVGGGRPKNGSHANRRSPAPAARGVFYPAPTGGAQTGNTSRRRSGASPSSLKMRFAEVWRGRCSTGTRVTRSTAPHTNRIASGLLKSGLNSCRR